MARRLKTKMAGIEYRPYHYFSLVLSVQIYVIRLASGTCFLACKAHQKAGGAYVGCQNWQSAEADRSDRSGLCNPNQGRFCNLESVCNPIWKGYVLPGL